MIDQGNRPFFLTITITNTIACVAVDERTLKGKIKKKLYMIVSFYCHSSSQMLYTLDEI